MKKKTPILPIIKSIGNGLLTSLPVVSSISENIKSAKPKQGQIDWTRLVGQLLGYAVQAYGLYLVAKGLLSPDELKQVIRVF